LFSLFLFVVFLLRGENRNVNPLVKPPVVRPPAVVAETTTNEKKPSKPTKPNVQPTVKPTKTSTNVSVKPTTTKTRGSSSSPLDDRLSDEESSLMRWVFFSFLKSSFFQRFLTRRRRRLDNQISIQLFHIRTIPNLHIEF
jgi:hypothetical protein